MKWLKDWTVIKGSRRLDLSEIDPIKLRALIGHRNLIEALDDWILYPDRRLINDLKQLALVVNKLYNYRSKIQLYRGFSPRLNYQDSMGLRDGDGSFFSKIKKYKKDDVFHYASDDKAISFSTSRDIARGFGTTLVSTVLDPTKQLALIITPELSKIICDRRNITDLQTQEEVIILPPFEIQFTIN